MATSKSKTGTRTPKKQKAIIIPIRKAEVTDEEYEDISNPNRIGDQCPNCGTRYTREEELMQYCNICNFDANEDR